MTKALSNDLRDRLIDAVDGGISCRAAAVRFGVAPSTAIKWLDRWRRTGERSSMLQGGDKRSHRIEAHGDFILDLIEGRKDITLAEIVDRLEAEHDLKVAHSTVWRFFERRGITFKKNRARKRAAKT
jgi:transposase